MTEPQVWTLIGVFAAGMFGTITLISTMFLRTMQNEFESCLLYTSPSPRD